MQQGVYSANTNVKFKPKSNPSEPIVSINKVLTLPIIQSNEIHIWVELINKLYTDDTGSFLIRLCMPNQYIIVSFYFESNIILQDPFKTKNDKHRVEAYNSIMSLLKTCGHKVDLEILYNKYSMAYKQVVK